MAATAFMAAWMAVRSSARSREGGWLFPSCSSAMTNPNMGLPLPLGLAVLRLRDVVDMVGTIISHPGGWALG